MPFQVLADTSIPRVLVEGTDPETGEKYTVEENTAYAQGTILEDEAVAPSVRDRLEEGDEHLSRLLRHISADEATEISDSEVEAAPEVVESFEEDLPQLPEEPTQSSTETTGPIEEASDDSQESEEPAEEKPNAFAKAKRKPGPKTSAKKAPAKKAATRRKSSAKK